MKGNVRSLRVRARVVEIQRYLEAIGLASYLPNATLNWLRASLRKKQPYSSSSPILAKSKRVLVASYVAVYQDTKAPLGAAETRRSAVRAEAKT